MSNKDFFQAGEADKWFIRNLESLEKRQEDKTAALLVDWLDPFKQDINSLVEIGCGSGHSLFYLSKMLDAEGYGVEPSQDANKFIKNKFPDLVVEVGWGDDIPFEGSFDFVHLGFFLYLVDRSRYLSSIKEADRVLKPGGFLSIVDFDTPFPYSNEYSHQKGVYSHKINNSNAFVATGMYSVVNKYQFSHNNFFFDKDINERVSLTLLYKEKEIFKTI